jgi:rsbT antagonist protein RsbS
MTIPELGRIPIIRMWDQLFVPLQGDVTDVLAERLQVEILDRIATTRVAGLVIDLTGMWLMDSHLCAVLSNLAISAKLMGTHTILCGMSPEIAVTLETMGIALDKVETALSVEEAFELLGLTMSRVSASDEEEAGEDDDEDDDDLFSAAGEKNDAAFLAHILARRR